MFALPRHQGFVCCLVQGGLGGHAGGLDHSTFAFSQYHPLAVLVIMRTHAGCTGRWGHTGGQDPSRRVRILPQWGEPALWDPSQSCLPRQDSGRFVLRQRGELAGSYVINMHG